MKLYQLARSTAPSACCCAAGCRSSLARHGRELRTRLAQRSALARRANQRRQARFGVARQNGLTTPVDAHAGVGEQSGNMGEMMDRAASFHARDLAGRMVHAPFEPI